MTLDEKIVEAVARAIVASRNLPESSEINWPAFRRDARAAITAYQAEAWPGQVLVPVEPTPELLRSMATRYDHGLGVPGYYDQPIFGAENVGHEKRLEATIRTMRQLHEEVVGTGFYRPAPKASP